MASFLPFLVLEVVVDFYKIKEIWRFVELTSVIIVVIGENLSMSLPGYSP